ncbi:EamA family transporter [Kineosporia sp. A_224]|uniref:EamA family transporter n=1 Tax=Kineosporia sp. A_224 TaxID=1962180 RepID=UPI000B4A7DA2|nr:DMT family transporter [Kineosporia sp. A_224]
MAATSSTPAPAIGTPGARPDGATRAAGRRPTGLGVLLSLVSFATFGTSGVFASTLLAAGWSSAGAVTARVGVAALVLTVPALVALRGKVHVLRRSWRPVVAYGVVAVAACQVAYFNAVSHLDVAVALLLEYLGTILVVGWMWLRHGHRPSWLTALGAALSVSGLVLVLDVLGAVRVDVVGVLWGLGAAAGLAAFFVLSAHSDDELPPIAMAWGGLAVGTVCLLLAGAAGIVALDAPRVDVEFAGRTTSWVWPVLGLSLVAAVVAYVAGITGTRILGARFSSFLGLTEVLFAVLFAWLLLDQSLTALQLVGGVVILAGVGVVKYAENA